MCTTINMHYQKQDSKTFGITCLFLSLKLEVNLGQMNIWSNLISLHHVQKSIELPQVAVGFLVKY